MISPHFSLISCFCSNFFFFFCFLFFVLVKPPPYVSVCRLIKLPFFVIGILFPIFFSYWLSLIVLSTLLLSSFLSVLLEMIVKKKLWACLFRLYLELGKY